jgi:DNA polymerase-3 subunit epsilon
MADHWIGRELLLLDLETDAPEPSEAFIIQAAVVHVRPGQDSHRRSWLAQPRREIPAGAVAVHEISTERARAEGRPITEVLIEIKAALGAWRDDVVLIGANVCYDLTVLDREFGRHLDLGRLSIGGPAVDTLLLDKRLDKWRKGSRRLKDTARHYGVDLRDAHDALADCEAAGRLAYKMVLRSMRGQWPRPRWGKVDPEERHARALVASDNARGLHDAQVLWHEQGQLGLAAYWRTPKAIAKTWERHHAGELTREEALEWIAGLPAAADRAESTARGCWPVQPRVPVAT